MMLMASVHNALTRLLPIPLPPRDGGGLTGLFLFILIFIYSFNRQPEKYTNVLAKFSPSSRCYHLITTNCCADV